MSATGCTPHGLALRISHLEAQLLKIKDQIQYLDSEAPQFKRINTLYTHIFKNIRATSCLDSVTLEAIEDSIEESNLLFCMNTTEPVFEKITEAKDILFRAISPAQIVSRRLMDGRDTGILDDLPELVKNKIGQLLQSVVVN